MDILNAVILGIVEGLTEFLPVSSTGHLILVEGVLGVKRTAAPWNTLLWVSQLGAILAVVVYFWRDLWRRTFHMLAAGWQNHILTKLFVAMIPTVILALLFKKVLDPLEDSEVAVAIALIVGAGIIELIDRRCRREIPQKLEDVTLRQALAIGAIQCLAMFPGTSRSAASIMGGMALGLTASVATEFSFYLAIPTMIAAAGKRLWEQRHTLTGADAGVVAIGSAVAFVVALLVVAAFMSYVRRYRFTPFVVYRVVLGVAVLIYYFTR